MTRGLPIDAPRWVESRLRRWVTGVSIAECVVSDLREEHAAKVTQLGAACAALWYAWTALGIVLQLRVARARERRADRARRAWRMPGGMQPSSDLRQALRQLLRTPVITAVASVSVAVAGA
jgi:hypothetical protein